MCDSDRSSNLRFLKSIINLLIQAKIRNLYINFHSHFPARESEWVLQNISTNFDQPNLPLQFSAGLHPWYLEEDLEPQLTQLQKLSTHPHLMAIGECGLDKICNTNFSLQQEAFRQQVSLANEINKPLIIHCVRAYDEVLAILNDLNNKVPVIFHGFNKSAELASQLVKKGYYLSFGKDLSKEHVQSYFLHLPLTSLLLETDDAEISIKELYTIASRLRNISVDELSLQLQKNTEKILPLTL